MAFTVYDENGRKYSIDPKNKLGEGGQGAVYRVLNDNKVAIKTLISSNKDEIISGDNSEIVLKDSEYYEKLSRKIRHVMALDAITGVKNLATPIAMLRKPHCGYVMRFMNDMENISHQMRRTEENILPLSNSNNSLQKKYKVLSMLANIIVELNAHGLVYCDYSPGNIFVSKGIDSHEVWLIDMDNLHFSGKTSSSIGTPHYRAPEIANGTSNGNTFFSDIYSFALLAYEYLTLSTPFCGTLSQETAEDDWDTNLEANENNFSIMAESGEIPFVYEGKGNDPIDESGIPPEYVFTEKVFELFKRTFGETGRKKPETRPSANEWREALEAACNSVSVCSNNHTHLGVRCRWCEYENSIKPNRKARDQNRYFKLVSEDYLPYEKDEAWDAFSPPSIRLYSKHELVVSHRINATTRKEIPDEFLTNERGEIDAHMEIRSNKIDVFIHGKGLAPSIFTWDYKTEPKGKSFMLKQNGTPIKVLSLTWEDAGSAAKGDSV